jgi:hypothetical protein
MLQSDSGECTGFTPLLIESRVPDLCDVRSARAILCSLPNFQLLRDATAQHEHTESALVVMHGGDKRPQA